MNPQPSPQWSVQTKRTVTISAVLFVIVLLWFVRSILPITIVSALIAFILNPLVTFLTRRVFISRESTSARRGIAAVITFLIAVFAITILFLVIIPDLIQEIAAFGQQIPRLLAVFQEDIELFLSQPIVIGDKPLTLEGDVFIALDRIEEITGTRDLSQILQLDKFDLTAAAETFIGSVRNLSGPAFSFVGGAFSTLINTIFLIMLTFYLLKDGNFFIQTIVAKVPANHQPDARRLFEELGNVWNAYLRGQIILSIIMGGAVYLAALLLGVPNAPILGLLAGLLEFIPNLGPLIALIPAAFLALLSTSSTIPALSGVPFMLVVIFVWTMLQNIEAVLLVPRIMGDSLDLHPLVVILAVLGGAAFGGALGVILAAPFVASGRVIAQYIYGKLTDTEPFRELENERIKSRETLLSKALSGFWSIVNERVQRRRKSASDAK